MASGFYIVNEGQRGVVLRFGQYSETTPAGLSWHLPYPAETVELVNVSQVRTIEIGYRKNVSSKVLKESLMLTDDENIIDIQFAVQYILKSPQEYLFNNREPDEAVLQAAESSIREVIGKGGAVIREITEKTGAKIEINDVGLVSIAAVDGESGQAAIDWINSIVEEPEIGKIYEGKVVKLMDFGAFVNFMGSRDGLVHISQLKNERVEKVSDVVKEGDVVKVKVLDIDGRGKVKLSMKEVETE